MSDQGSNEASSFFTSLANTKPFLKVAFEGFAGSGKTRTMAELAIGVWKRIGSTKPIGVYDTEKAAMFLRAIFARNGIDPDKMILYKESRTLADLKRMMQFGRDGMFDVMMIDSITHVWENFLLSYQDQTGKKRLQFEDWGILKPKWKREFSEPFVRDRYHTLMCGRAGYEYADPKTEDPNTGKVKREIYKSGVKMKVEGETAYEPDMLVMMERFEDVLTDKKQVWREATVIKDRSGLIDGHTFKNPTYANFEPAVEFLLSNPSVRDAAPETENSFETDEEQKKWRKRRDIALENLEATIIELGLNGTAQAAKAARVEAFKAVFETASWTAIQGMKPEQIEAGIESLKKYVEKRHAEAGEAA